MAAKEKDARRQLDVSKVWTKAPTEKYMVLPTCCLAWKDGVHWHLQRIQTLHNTPNRTYQTLSSYRTAAAVETYHGELYYCFPQTTKC